MIRLIIPMVRFYFFLYSAILFGVGADSDAAFPSYLRGLHWEKVQEYLNEDMRLSDAVVPYHYALDLAVNVRGHEGANRSDFNGTVSIFLKFRKPVDKIELHANGLIIESAQLLESLILSTPVAVTKLTTSTQRETVTIHANRTINPDEEFMLQARITYRGVAKMDEYGLYESWDPKFNKSIDSNGPFVLASRNFPTGARFWFPCFDEPERNATFELQVIHPSGLNVYSNTGVERTESLSEGRTLSVFGKTHSIPTYQVALSVNHLSSKKIDVKGLGKVRVIRSNNSLEIPSPQFRNRKESWEKGIRYFGDDVLQLLQWKLETMDELILGAIPKEKLDIIILEGSTTISYQPGLVTLGSYSLREADFVRDLTKLVTRNLITTKHANHIWLNDILTDVLTNRTVSNRRNDDEYYDQILYASLLERPLRDTTTYSTSTRQYLDLNNPIPYLKASQVLKMLFRMCPASKESIREFITISLGGFADIDDFIDTVSKSCTDPDAAKEFLEGFINQAGKPLLVVHRAGKMITIAQTRYHSTYFDSEFRDNKTRYTIPIFFTIDGKPGMKVFRKNESAVTIDVPETSMFLIDHDSDHLYFVFYDNIVAPQRNFTESERNTLMLALRKSMIVALNIGYARGDRIFEQLAHYVEAKIFTDLFDLQATFSKMDLCALYWNVAKRSYRTSWDGMFNNDTQFWKDEYNDYEFTEILHCMHEWYNSTTYLGFLEQNFLGENTAIRPDQFNRLAEGSSTLFHQWRELHRFFFKHAGNFIDHRMDMLAGLVLAQFKLSSNGLAYPNDSIYDDYHEELRHFVIRNPRRAASMATEIAMRLEREFIKEELPKFHKVETLKSLLDEHSSPLEKRRVELRNGQF